MNQREFTFRELQELAIIIEVDIRVAERLGVQSSHGSRTLLDKVNRLLVERAKEMHLAGDDK